MQFGRAHGVLNRAWRQPQFPTRVVYSIAHGPIAVLFAIVLLAGEPYIPRPGLNCHRITLQGGIADGSVVGTGVIPERKGAKGGIV